MLALDGIYADILVAIWASLGAVHHIDLLTAQAKLSPCRHYTFRSNGVQVGTQRYWSRKQRFRRVSEVGC